MSSQLLTTYKDQTPQKYQLESVQVGGRLQKRKVPAKKNISSKPPIN